MGFAVGCCPLTSQETPKNTRKIRSENGYIDMRKMQQHEI